MSASLRLIRFVRMTVLVAVALTIFDVVLIVGWQLSIFLTDGNWRALPLSSVFKGSSGSEIYSTASIDKIASSYRPNLADALLQVPIIVPLLLGAALLTAFYFWLSDAERRYSKN